MCEAPQTLADIRLHQRVEAACRSCDGMALLTLDGHRDLHATVEFGELEIPYRNLGLLLTALTFTISAEL